MAWREPFRVSYNINTKQTKEKKVSNIRKWADEQQFVAQPISVNKTPEGMIVPRVTLLTCTEDPLGANAAMGRMYKGIPTYSMADITDEERLQFFQDSMATHLKAPLEAIKFHFFIEGVTRSFTHQMVRQRTAVYAQESLRFAVKEELADEVSIPPSIAALAKHHPTRQEWDKAVDQANKTYNFLVANGIPAEDARGLMPHAVTTRLNYVTDLRNLAEHAGNRLCTQAQFEWRSVFLGIIKAIREYTPDFGWAGASEEQAKEQWEARYRWQFQAIAESALFRPICYQLGKCPFKASFDRACTIRQRVDTLSANGVPSSEWHTSIAGDLHISNREWLLDPGAARLVSGGGGHD
jgi:flavin-dependent thymidylate synthase